MLYRLIFRRGQYPLVYASFPITAVRDDPERRAALTASAGSCTGGSSFLTR